MITYLASLANIFLLENRFVRQQNLCALRFEYRIWTLSKNIYKNMISKNIYERENIEYLNTVLLFLCVFKTTWSESTKAEYSDPRLATRDFFPSVFVASLKKTAFSQSLRENAAKKKFNTLSKNTSKMSDRKPLSWETLALYHTMQHIIHQRCFSNWN